MIRIRITPLLRTLGFKENKDGLYVSVDRSYEARIYKLDEHTRCIDMWKNVSDSEGGVHHREMMLKRFALDGKEADRSSFEEFLLMLGWEFGNLKVVDNADYYFFQSEQRQVNDREPVNRLEVG